MNDAHRMKQLGDTVAQFAKDRDWDQFHTPKNLAMALSGEVGELVELFQWLTPEQSAQLDESKKAAVENEIADVFIYLIRLSQKLDVDLISAAFKKIDINEARYPADKVRGSARKYNDSGDKK